MGSSISRKLLMEGAMLDYDDTGANTKHEPRKKPGKPWWLSISNNNNNYYIYEILI